MNDFEKVFIGLGSVAIPMICVPTLAEMSGLEPKRSTTWSLTPELVRRHLTFSNANIRQGRWYTRFTFAFVHKNVQHLVGNLSMFLPSGVSVIRAFGVLGFYFIFFGGCAASTMNVGGIRAKQSENALKSSFRVSSSSSESGVLGRALDSINDGLNAGAKLLAPTVSNLMVNVGASGGCCALLGVDICLTAEALLNMPSRRFDKRRRTDDIALGLVSLYFSATLIAEEIRIFTTSGSRDGIDHLGHILGIGFGVGCFTLFRVLQRLVSLG